MSRVRILNLPRNCTEDQLRSHLLKSLPPDGPHIEITDCVILKRAPRPGARGRGTPRKSPAPDASEKGVIRMAFIGFRNAASGHFIVRHLDGTYFGEAKLQVHVAKGLADVGVTTNMRKKLGKEEQEENNQSSTIKYEGTGEKRARDVELGTKDGKAPNADGAGESEEDAKKRKRREEFVTERIRATTGPTWATEVLVPELSADAEASPTGDCDGGNGDAEPQGKKEQEDPNIELEKALERQKKLGEISDMDFLSSLAKESANQACSSNDASGGGGSDKRKGEVLEKGDESEEDQLLCPENPSPRDDQEEVVRESRRIRLGNIPFIATEEDVKQFASSHVGPVEAVHIPLTRDTKQSKGAAFVKFARVEDAVNALSRCQGAIFMGRLLRVSAATEDPYAKRSEETAGGLAGNSEFKRQKAKDRRKEGEGTSGVAPVAWSSTYMNSHTAVETVAKRLGVTADAVVSVDARGAAVRAAIAEAYLTSEIKEVLGDEGIDFSLLESARENLLKARSNTTILVKNVTLGDPADAAQLSKMFLKYGTLEATAFPSAGAFALFRYVHQQDARVAFQRLSYKLFKNAPLFLEWAPIGSLSTAEDGGDCNDRVPSHSGNGRVDDVDEDGNHAGVAAGTPHFTLFITNIPFNSTKEDFNTFLLDSCPRLARAPDKFVERLELEQGKGRAFLTLRDASTMSYVQQRLNGRTMAGRTLACVVSKQTTAAINGASPASRATGNGDGDGEDGVAKVFNVISRRGAGQSNGNISSDSNVPPGCDGLKLVVKNVPFEATERDIRDLFTAISEVRSVRLPRKSHQFSSHRENNHRGFAFVEFLTEEEARRAKQTLGSTHLYGRHLVIQYAKLDES